MTDDQTISRCAPLIAAQRSPLSSQTLYTNALRALEQLMEGLMQRQLDPKGLQEMVHVSCLAGGPEPGMATPPGKLA